MDLTIKIGICQNCGRPFSLEKCEKDTIDFTLVWICPHCRHGNYDDNVSGHFYTYDLDI